MYSIFRVGRLAVVAFATYLAAGCGSTVMDQSPPQTMAAPISAPSVTRLAEVQLRVGRAAFDEGDLRTALEFFEKAHKTAPQDAKPVLGRGDVLFAERRFDAAVTAYRAALALNSRLFEAYEGLGKALVSNQKYRAGLDAFEAALAIRRNAPLLNKIGVTHEMLGHGEIAQKHYRAALALQPQSLTARNNLALSLGVSGAYEDALKEIERVVVSQEANERHRANLAFIYGLSGRSMDQAPAEVARAAADKGWTDEFFARTRKLAESGDRTAVLDLLNNRQPLPAVAALSAMPEMPTVAPEIAAVPAVVPAPPPAPAKLLASEPDSDVVALVVPPPPAAPIAAESADPVLAKVELPTEQVTEQYPQQPAEQVVDGPTEASVELAMQTPPEAPLEAPKTPAVPAMTAPVAVAAPVDAGGDFRVELGAFKTTRWLSATLARLGATAGDLLPLRRLNVAFEKNLYLVSSAGLPDRAAAKQLCQDLRALEFECFVTRKSDRPSGQSFDVASTGDSMAISRFVAKLSDIQTTAVAQTPPAEQKAVNNPDLAVSSEITRRPDAGEYRVQLAAYRLARHLERGMEVLRKAAGDLLPPLESLTRDGAGKQSSIPFRLRSAPLESRAVATALCAALQDRGVECLVIRHGASHWRPLA